MKRAFWLAFGAMMVIYAMMALWSLPRIARDAGGLMPFDLRPFGYDFDEARAFLAALTPEGTAFYRDVQHGLDLAYPALLAATLVLATLLLSPRGWGAARWLLAILVLPGTAFDYCENAAVGAMLAAGADGLAPDLVARASGFTALKSAFNAFSLTIVLVLLARQVILRFR